jgi:proline iminopeptidase
MNAVEINGVRLAYTDSGNGIPLMCLHGGMGIDGYALRVPGILDLAAHGVRVIIPDQRGHGDSDRSDPSLYTRETWADDAHALIERLGATPCALLGYSYGGFIALDYALRWPGTLTKLVLVATSAGPVQSESQAFASERDLRRFFRGIWPRLFAGEERHWDLFESAKFSVDAYNAAFLNDLPRYDARARIREFDLPALLIVGRHDPYLRDMEWLANAMPRAELRVMEDTGHFPFVEKAADFTGAVLTFLTGGELA